MSDNAKANLSLVLSTLLGFVTLAHTALDSWTDLGGKPNEHEQFLVSLVALGLTFISAGVCAVLKVVQAQQSSGGKA